MMILCRPLRGLNWIRGIFIYPTLTGWGYNISPFGLLRVLAPAFENNSEAGSFGYIKKGRVLLDTPFGVAFV